MFFKKLAIFLMFIILIFMLKSCVKFDSYLPQFDYYTFRYDSKITNIDSLIFVDGYFQPLNPNNVGSRIMMYRDGTFASFFSLRKILINNLIMDSISHIMAWGSYKIIGDTIKTQSIFFIDTWFSKSINVIERWFKVITRDTLVELHFLNSLDTNYQQKSYGTKLYFTPAIRPDSSCWLKEEKWAWENGVIKK